MNVAATNHIGIDFDELPVSDYWSESPHQELKMHKIHAYPAKFPALVVNRSIEYARNKQIRLEKIVDVFCGCGTTALEARVNNLDFWGCDINPVAALIARTKSEKFEPEKLNFYFSEIIKHFDQLLANPPVNDVMRNERIRYWFDDTKINQLNCLLCAIRVITPEDKYRDFFLCAFSNILKGCSRWLTKSIKPQLDKSKIPQDVETAFVEQVGFMIKANHETSKRLDETRQSEIRNANFLDIKVDLPFADMLITSPPYATSYEYADLHQLSTLWLGYADDYRDLREGTIGSLFNKQINDSEREKLCAVGRDICDRLSTIDKRKARSVAKYFSDIKATVKKTYDLLRNQGIAVYVIGNTQYKTVKIDNTKYLVDCLATCGFSDINVFKRKVSSKTLTPYRDPKGRFSGSPKDKEVYGFEFVVLATKC